MIPDRVERRARWVLDSIGAGELGFGDDLPYRAEAWEAMGRSASARYDRRRRGLSTYRLIRYELGRESDKVLVPEEIFQPEATYMLPAYRDSRLAGRTVTRHGRTKFPVEAMAVPGGFAIGYVRHGN